MFSLSTLSILLSRPTNGELPPWKKGNGWKIDSTIRSSFNAKEISRSELQHQEFIRPILSSTFEPLLTTWKINNLHDENVRCGLYAMFEVTSI